MIPNGCPLCGTPSHSCGQPFTGTPIDLPRTESTAMGEVQRYRVTANGHETVLKLTVEDAKNYEDAELVEAKSVKPTNKARTGQNKARTSGSASDA